MYSFFFQSALSFEPSSFLVVSIVEVLPKEKKQKEEKVSILSQCSVDLFPLFNAHEPLTFTLELYSVLSDGNADTPKVC